METNIPNDTVEENINPISRLNSATNLLHKRHKPVLLRRTASFGGTVNALPTTNLPEIQKSNKNTRWIILLLSCFLLFGNLYAYDNPAALNIPMQKHLNHDYDTWQYELNLLYSVYSFPNMFLPLLGGQLIDHLDQTLVLLGFSSIVCIGQTIFALGVSAKSFSLMIVGRVLFGIGGESISVAQAAITSRWFKNKELAFALGASTLKSSIHAYNIDLCIARLGSVSNSILSPRIEKAFGVSAAVWIGSVMCYLSFFSAVILSGIMKIHDSSKKNIVKITTLDCINQSDSEENESNDEKQVLIERPSGEAFDSRGGYSDIFLLPPSFWILCIICILLYGTVIPFNNIVSDFLMSKWYHNDTETAGIVMSIPDSISAILVPICGIIVDSYGKRVTFLLLCSLLIMFVHLTLGLTMLTPVIPLIFLGFSYSMYGVAIWPSVATIAEHEESKMAKRHPHLTPPKLVGTAFGVSQSALNTALTLFPIITAGIRVDWGSFVAVEIFFASLAALGALMSIVLWRSDRFNDNILQLPETLKNQSEL